MYFLKNAEVKNSILRLLSSVDIINVYKIRYGRLYDA